MTKRAIFFGIFPMMKNQAVSRAIKQVGRKWFPEISARVASKTTFCRIEAGYSR